ncbi:MAG: site-specific DNA-methyltransferase [Spirochaetota bacterium]
MVLINNDILAALETIPNHSIGLIISSPPYNLGKEYETKLDLDDYLAWQTEVLKGLFRVLSPDGNIVWQVGNFVHKGEVYPLDIYFYPIFKEFGLQLRNRIIWHFEHGLHSKKRFSGRYEVLLWFTKSEQYTFNLDAVRVPSKYPGKRHYKGERKGQLSGNPLGKNPSDFWSLIQSEWEEGVIDIPNVKFNHPEKTIHPCQFPIELVERCVLALSNADDWVLDPFGGVASSVIAAIKHRRKAISIEQNQEYMVIAEHRIREYYRGNLAIRPLGKPVYQPTGREKVAQIPHEWTGEKKGVLF